MRTGPSYAHTSPSQLIKNIFMRIVLPFLVIQSVAKTA